MNFKLIFIILISIFLISCTPETNGSDNEEVFILNEGKGYEISFDYANNLPHGDDHEIKLEFKNTGTHDIEKLDFSFSDNAFIRFTDKSFEDSLKGRSLGDPLPNVLSENFNFHTISKEELGLKDINERSVSSRWKVNFDYSTSDSLNICLDLDEGDICNYNSIRSEKEGSPILVSFVDWDILTYSDEIRVFFDIHLENVGDGIPFIENNEKKQNHIQINSLSVAGKDCEIEEKEINLNLNKIIQCDISLDKETDSRITVMSIDFDYIYHISDSIQLNINYR